MVFLMALCFLSDQSSEGILTAAVKVLFTFSVVTRGLKGILSFLVGCCIKSSGGTMHLTQRDGMISNKQVNVVFLRTYICVSFFGD